MKSFSELLPSSAWTLLAVVLLASGCRTYGAYDNEAKLLDEIRRANILFAEDYERAQGNLTTLKATAASNDRLASFVEPFGEVVEVQEAILDQHRMMAEDAEANDGNYRLLNRTYGAIISDQAIISDRYVALLAEMQHTVDSTSGFVVPEEGRFQVAPQFYDRIAYANAQRSLSDILAMARAGTPAPMAMTAPDTTAAN